MAYKNHNNQTHTITLRQNTSLKPNNTKSARHSNAAQVRHKQDSSRTYETRDTACGVAE